MRRFNKKKHKTAKKKRLKQLQKKRAPIVVKTNVNKQGALFLIKPKESDYLKYFSACYKYVMARYNVTYDEIGMLLFLYSEGVFTGKHFNEYRLVNEFTPYGLNKLIKKGFVIRWRHNSSFKTNLYKLSTRGDAMIIKLYRLLNGEDQFSTDSFVNKLKRTTNSTYDEYSVTMTRLNHEKKAHAKKTLTTLIQGK